jgi:hypothetical protein
VYQQENPVGVTVNQARHGALVLFFKRIIRLTGRPDKLVNRRNHRAPQRLGGIVNGQKAHVVRRNAHGQFGAGMVTDAFFCGRKIQYRLKLTIMTDTVSDLPLPIIPGLVGYTGEKLAPKSARF